MLALPLLWAAYEHTATVNGTEYSLIPQDLGQKILKKWQQAGGDPELNPIEKIPFSVQQLGDQMVVVPLCKVPAARGRDEGVVPVMEAGLMGGEAAGGVCSDIFFSQLFHMQQ